MSTESNTRGTDAREKIAQTHDFKDGLGPVPAHRHINPDGAEGGWVAETASVADFKDGLGPVPEGRRLMSTESKTGGTDAREHDGADETYMIDVVCMNCGREMAIGPGGFAHPLTVSVPRCPNCGCKDLPKGSS